MFHAINLLNQLIAMISFSLHYIIIIVQFTSLEWIQAVISGKKYVYHHVFDAKYINPNTYNFLYKKRMLLI